MFLFTPEMVNTAFPKVLLGVFLVSAIGCCMGFHEFVWFMSVGYGFATMVIGLFLLVSSYVSGVATIATTIMCLLFIVYGFRLGGYLLLRELKNAGYKKTLESTGSTKKMPIFVSLFMWVYCSFEYVTQTSCVTYRLINNASDNIWAWVGIAVMTLAVIGESVADKQKSAAKAINPKRFCDTGLFKIVRCPNYFSEIMFWVGVTLSGIGTVTGKQWIFPAIGIVLIVIVMVNGAQRLEKRHEKNYGNDPEYRKYADSTPILFPLVPIYHLNKKVK